MDTLKEMYGAISGLFFLHFKKSPYLLQLFREIKLLCFAMKFIKCFVEYES